MAKQIPLNKKQYANLFENEFTSDVVLMVGEDEDNQERVPGHTWVLVNGSDYFRALFEGPLANSTRTVYRFPDNPKGFNNLIKWIYQDQCDIQILQSSLDTLQIAIKYLCPELADYCIRHMTKQLNADNVLIVLGWIYKYCYPNSSYIPSAPSYENIMEEKEKEQNKTRNERRRSSSDERDVTSLDPTMSCYQLLKECLDVIDKQAEKVLTSESLLTVDEHVLYIIMGRDTLNIKSELIIFNAIHRWSTSMCKRKQKLLTQESKRNILGQLLFVPRYLTMRSTDINNVKIKRDLANLLTEEELAYVTSTINGSHENVIPYSMLDVREVMSSRRSSYGSVCTLKSKKPKKLKKKLVKRDIILDLVSFLALIFD